MSLMMGSCARKEDDPLQRKAIGGSWSEAALLQETSSRSVPVLTLIELPGGP